jgi:hypothetical protein
MLVTGVITLLGLGNLAAGHFLLNYPPSIGFNDDMEGTGPCGGFTPIFNDSLPSVTVGRFPVELRSTHPQADWLFRATLDKKAPFNWTNLLPVVTERGLGDFCIPNIKAPAEFAGQSGLIQVMQDAVDGILFQVSFIFPFRASPPSGC